LEKESERSIKADLDLSDLEMKELDSFGESNLLN
jgi:hypothetical protein